MADHGKIRIAITGGGLAGAALINALQKHPHLSVNIFEAAPAFKERGAAVSLGRNAQNAMAELGSDIADVLDRAGAVQMQSSRLMIGHGPEAGQHVFDLASNKGAKVVHRAALLEQLLKSVPNARMHASKKLSNIESMEDGGLLLSFEDGSQFEADALIGADGIRGMVRSHILGLEHPDAKPAFAGFWDCRNLVPFELAKTAVGEPYFKTDETRQYGWVGDGAFLMHDAINGGETVHCAACCLVDESDSLSESYSNDSLDRERLENFVDKCFSGLPIKDGILQMLSSNSDLKAYSHWHFPHTPTFTQGRICIMGDAAHAMTPWQGSGAGQAMEDVLVLDTLLRQLTRADEIDAALRAYDEVRRPRAQAIATSSQETGLIMCGRGSGVGRDVGKLKAALEDKWAFIHDQDQKQQKADALLKWQHISNR